MIEKEFKGTGDIPSGFSLRYFLFVEKKKVPKWLSKPGQGVNARFVRAEDTWMVGNYL